MSCVRRHLDFFANELTERLLKTNHKLACAITAILSGPASVVWAATAADESTSGLEEITVTAQRRSESIQDVPITIQAITGESLGQLSVTTFDDVIKLLPNVTFSSNGPGQGNIYMRGLSVGFAGSQSSASINPFPNVATYLDDQSLTFPGRNLDVYMVDMERIEVLEGPQGTLFGGGAEAGALRYITNKPKLNVTEGRAEGGYGITAHGDPNTSANVMLNLPLIDDKLAIRGVIYSDRRGGYIDNVPTTFTRNPNVDKGPSAYSSSYPAHLDTYNNYLLVQKRAEPDHLPGASPGRALPDQRRLERADSADLPVYGRGRHARADAGGLGVDAAAARCRKPPSLPAWNKDKAESTAWTVNGKFGDLKADLHRALI